MIMTFMEIKFKDLQQKKVGAVDQQDEKRCAQSVFFFQNTFTSICG